MFKVKLYIKYVHLSLQPSESLMKTVGYKLYFSENSWKYAVGIYTSACVYVSASLSRTIVVMFTCPPSYPSTHPPIHSSKVEKIVFFDYFQPSRMFWLVCPLAINKSQTH